MTGKLPFSPGTTLSMGLLLPIGGWLADAYLGRYRVIRYGMWTMWFGALLNGLSLVIGKVIETYGTYADPWVSLFSKVVMGLGLGAFQANIVQFGLDQLIDASSTEITSFIMWYTLTIFTSSVTMKFSSSCVPEYVAVLVVAVFLTSAIGSDFLLGHWLTKEHAMSNPLPLIIKVVYFVINRKCKGQNTNFLQQQGFLSAFNIAKRVCSGPFTSEQVEDVKTFFRVLVVVMIFSMVVSGSTTVNNISYLMAVHLKRNSPVDSSNIGICYHNLNIYFATFVHTTVVALIYIVVIRPLFHSCIPRVSIITKFSLSVLLYSAALLALSGIELATFQLERRSNQTTFKCLLQTDIAYPKIDINVHWVILPNILNGLSMFFIILSGIEFVCAQAPFSMKGLLLGLACALFGLGVLIHAVISQPFKDPKVWQKSPLTCGMWYFIMEGILVLIGLIVTTVIIKTYKRRARINVYLQSEWQETD